MFTLISTAYNTEKYIKECIDSVLNQTYTDFEFIIIDDGSTDNTWSIIDSYNDPRIIKIKLPENKGISYGRNLGIDRAKGDWIGIIDSDDYIIPEYLSYLGSLIKEYPDLDMIFWPFKSQVEIKGEPNLQHFDIPIPHFSDNPFEVYDYYTLSMGACMVKKEIYNDVRFPVGYYHEDVGTLYKLLLNSKHIYLSDKPIYIYRQREGSITHSHSKKRYLDLFQMSYNEYMAVKDHLSDKGNQRLRGPLYLISNLIAKSFYRNEETELAYQVYEEMESQMNWVPIKNN